MDTLKKYMCLDCSEEFDSIKKVSRYFDSNYKAFYLCHACKSKRDSQ